MANTYRIELDDHDLGQLIDGLNVRADAWQKTADYLRTEKMPEGEIFLIEECGDPEEAQNIAGHYRTIIRKIQIQVEAQS